MGPERRSGHFLPFRLNTRLISGSNRAPLGCHSNLFVVESWSKEALSFTHHPSEVNVFQKPGTKWLRVKKAL